MNGLKAHYIMGLNCAYHESSVCILKDGKLVSYMEEERLNRIKHAKSAEIETADEVPIASIKYCLEKAGITAADIDHIGFNFDPKERLSHVDWTESNHAIHENSWGTPAGEKLFYQKNLNVVKKLSEFFERDVTDIFHFIKHHVSHAAGTYYSSGFDEAAVLVIDGIAEHCSTWVGYGKGTEMGEYYEIDYPSSIGFVWEKMSEFLGFTEYEAEKVMGLASYGDYKKEIGAMMKLIHIEGDRGFVVDNEILLFRTGDFSRLEVLFGVSKRNKGEPLAQKHQDIAGAMQHITEEIVLHLAKKVKELSGSDNLCVAGGTALNVVSNARLVNSGIFKNVYIQPEANDAGGAMGAAFYTYANILKLGKPEPIHTAYLGPAYSNEYIASVLEKTPELEFEFKENIGEVTATLLTEGNLVGWLQGAMEAGPRALGHRSLIADPRRTDVMDLINKKVKLREYFRPIAPSCLEEEVTSWFDISGHIPSPAYYMLMAVNVREGKGKLIPAVTHVDGTSRVQAVNKERSPEYWNLINEFFKLTGVPMIINTSLNIQEPIVCSPEDAIKTYLNSGIDYLVLENYLCKRKKQS